MKWWEILIQILHALFAPRAAKPAAPKAPKPAASSQKPSLANIDWTNPDAKISKYFCVGEALWLPSWKVLHIPSENEKKEIFALAQKMDLVREEVGPIKVHVWIRPVLNQPGHVNHGQDYNRFIYEGIWRRAGLTPEEIKTKIAPNSRHKYGMAVDWSSPTTKCDELRAKLIPKLEGLGLRMEDRPGSDWVHNDSGPVVKDRFFKP